MLEKPKAVKHSPRNDGDTFSGNAHSGNPVQQGEEADTQLPGTPASELQLPQSLTRTALAKGEFHHPFWLSVRPVLRTWMRDDRLHWSLSHPPTKVGDSVC